MWESALSHGRTSATNWGWFSASHASVAKALGKAGPERVFPVNMITPSDPKDDRG